MRHAKNPERVKRITDSVEKQNLVFRYDASIIIDFLNRTFMPPEYFFKHEFLHHDLKNKPVSFIRHSFLMKEFYDAYLDMDTLYEYYLLYREKVRYTKEVETRYQFSVIIRRMNFERNGWKFYVRRLGRKQTLVVGPLMLRVKVPPEHRDLFDIPETRASEEQIVEAPMMDTGDDIIEDPTLES